MAHVYLNGEKLSLSLPNATPIFGHGLKTSKVDGKTVVSVDTVDNFDGDKTLPMSASGVETIIGNIDALLGTI